MPDGPYQFRDDLPHAAREAANTLDSSKHELPDDDWLPIGATTRFEAAARLLHDLETRRGLDTVRVLLGVVGSNLDTDEIERAVQREEKLKRANQSDEHRGGRPSKVDHLAGRIATSCRMAERGEYEGADDQIRARNRQITQTLMVADISRGTFYNLRGRVLEEHGIDLSEIASPSEVVMA